MTILLLLGATWQVALDGSGDFTTLSDALGYAAAGDTIELAPGTYAPSTGEQLPYYFPGGIQIVGSGHEITTLDAEGEETFGSILSDGVVISDLALANAADTAIRGLDAAPTIDRCRFAGNGIGVSLVEGGSISDSVFEDNGDERYDVSAIGGYGGELVNVRVADVPDVAAYAVYLSAYQALTPSIDGLYVVSAGVGVQGDARNVVVLGCPSHDTSSTCLGVGGQLTNATVVGCERGVAIHASYVRSALTAFNAGTGFDGAQYAAYNLTYANAGGDWASAHDWSGQLSNITGSDPLFRAFSDDGDWSNDDFRLQEGSPAIDAAAADFPATDIDGVPRPQDGDGDGRARADIGAYEWGEFDVDGDGWYVDGGDCDDADPDIHPGVDDIPYNGIDEDCDGTDLIDVDGDGHAAEHQGGTDCDDTNAAIHPGAWDIPGNGIDEDCDGVEPIDTDGDGWPDDQDCASDDATVHFGADEACDGIDNNCNGEIDEACDEDTGEGEDTDGRSSSECACFGCRSDQPASALSLLPIAALVRRRRRRDAP